VSYTREGAKKWSDQCQISAFTASVCDLQKWPRAVRMRVHVCARRSSAKLRVRQAVNYPAGAHTHTRTRAQRRAGTSPLPSFLPPSCPCRATECSLSAGVAGPCNEQKAEITKRPRDEIVSLHFVWKTREWRILDDPYTRTDPSNPRISRKPAASRFSRIQRDFSVGERISPPSSAPICRFSNHAHARQQPKVISGDGTCVRLCAQRT